MTAVRSYLLFAAIAAMAAWGANASRRNLLQAGSEQIPEACSASGLQLQNDCAKEIDEGMKAFGLSGTDPSQASQIKLTQDQIKKYLASARKPSPVCCKTACQFNSNLCNCNAGILAFISGYMGNNNDPQIYNTLANSFGSACGFKVYVGNTCPANPGALKVPFGAACPTS